MSSSDLELVPPNTTNEEPNIEDLMAAEAASSYDKNKFTFKYALGKLLDICVEKVLYFKPRPGGKTERPAWSNNVEKLSRIFKASNESSQNHFRSMFRLFFMKHRDALVKPLFDDAESDKINDEFFSSKERFDVPGDSKLAKDSALGPVLYLNTDKPDMAAFNLPIGEVYRAAVSLCVRLGDKGNSDIDLKPILSLLYFYVCLLHSFNEDDCAEDVALVEKNLSDLCDAAEATAPGSGPFNTVLESAATAPSNPINFLLGMAQNMGLGDNATDALKGASGIFNKIVSEISKPGDDGSPPPQPGDIGSLLDRFGSVLKNPEIRDDFMATSEKFSGALSGISSTALSSMAENAGDIVKSMGLNTTLPQVEDIDESPGSE